MVTNGQQPSIIQRFAAGIPVYLTGHEILNFLYQILGLTVLVRVDNQTYLLLGDVDPNLVNGTIHWPDLLVSPSSTIFTGMAGPMEVNLTFLNPIVVSFYSFANFNVYIRIILSHKTGSSNPSHSRICLSLQIPRIIQVTMCRCIRTLVEVLAINL